MIWTQSTLRVGLCVFRIKFGFCAHYFFLFLLKLPMIDIELLSYIHLICHTHCQKLGKQAGAELCQAQVKLEVIVGD